MSESIEILQSKSTIAQLNVKTKQLESQLKVLPEAISQVGKRLKTENEKLKKLLDKDAE